MTNIIRIASNAVVGKLFGTTPEAESLVNETLSYMVENAGFASTFGSSSFDGRSSFYSFKSQSFPAGFVSTAYAALVKAGFQVQIVKKPLPKPLGSENPIVDKFGNDNPDYDFQLGALRQIEAHGAGIIQVATGGGKSKISKLIIARYRRPSLFLTTRGVLMHQMKRGYEAQGFNVGVIGDGEWKVVRGVNVGMVQTLVAHLKVDTVEHVTRALIKADFPTTGPALQARHQLRAEAERRIAEQEARRARATKVLELFEVVIGEEAHEAGGDSYFQILQACKNAHIRVALTATPFMRDDEQDNMRLMAAFGPVLLKVSEETLIRRGILAKPFFRFVAPRGPDMLKASTPWARAYELGFIENPWLNEQVIADAVKAKTHGLPVMTLIQRTKHGNVLQKGMEEAGLRVEFIKGADDNAGRKRALDRLAANDIDALIGTNILDVGVDVPAVGLVQLAGGGKAEVAMRQRIGRGLRAKKTGPNVCFIADYSTVLNSYHRKHTAERRRIVQDTPGFAEGILPADADFPWELFAAERRQAA